VTLRFIVDAQLPPAPARFLTDAGYASEHVHDVAAEAYPDAQLWDRAVATKAAIVTKDEDFVIRSVRDSAPPAIVWVRLGNTRNKALLDGFSFLLPKIATALERGETLVELI
jgi:predicted nuclease of predicted toxin-antitoxin system